MKATIKYWDKQEKRFLDPDHEQVPLIDINLVPVEPVIATVNGIPDVFNHNVSDRYDINILIELWKLKL